MIHPIRRGGLSLVEMLLAVALGGATLGLLSGFMLLSNRLARTAGTLVDETQSIQIASETLRRDFRRLAFQTVRDLSIDADGRACSLLVARSGSSDLWSVQGDAVRYFLSEVAHHPGVFQLMRADPGGTRPVAGCQLSDLKVRFIPAGEKVAGREFLEVTLVPLERSSQPDPVKLLFPVFPMSLPHPTKEKPA